MSDTRITAAQKRFENLQWEELERWSDSKILQRGKSYRDNVKQLAMTVEGELIAIVEGRDSYLTKVYFEGGRLESQCSCPYWDVCKHAVALVLHYLEQLKTQREIDVVESDEWDIRAAVYNASAGPEEIDERQLQAQLEDLSKGQLIEALVAVAHQSTALFYGLVHIEKPKKALVSPDQIVAQLRHHINKTTSERGWSDRWSGECNTPDYSMVEALFSELLDNAFYEQIMELGNQLLILGMEQVAESDDDGDTAYALEPCLEIIIEGVAQSNLTAADKWLWYHQWLLEDDYCLLDGIDGPIKEDQLSKGDWVIIAQEYRNKAALLAKDSHLVNFSQQYKYNRLIRYVSYAHEQGGEVHKVQAFLKQQLQRSNDHLGLIDHLMAQGEFSQAEHWAHIGFSVHCKKSPGIASSIIDRLKLIAQKNAQWADIVLLNMALFIGHPSIDRYSLALSDPSDGDSAIKAALVAQRTAMLQYIETGQLPEFDADSSVIDIVNQLLAQRHRLTLGATSLLIEIALQEQRIDDAVSLFERTGDRIHAQTIADLVQVSKPQLSLDIWRDEAQQLIARVKPSAYVDAMHYVKKTKTLLISLARETEFQRYIEQLRQQHKPKRRLMQELDKIDATGMAKKAIIDSF